MSQTPNRGTLPPGSALSLLQAPDPGPQVVAIWASPPQLSSQFLRPRAQIYTPPESHLLTVSGQTKDWVISVLQCLAEREFEVRRCHSQLDPAVSSLIPGHP